MLPIRPITVAFAGTTLICSWLLMMIFHELGHVINAWLSGGHVSCVVLHPFAISRTDVAPNPHPVFERWGGALWGCTLPLLAWQAGRIARADFAYLLRFLSGFCLVANGAYLSAGLWYPVGDAAQLLALGTPEWMLAAFGIPACAGGLVLWNGLGPHFGIGPDARPVDSRIVSGMMALTATIISLELLLSTCR